ncbi:MAG TPA: hypothetical protein DD473_16265 [Planctomycetaceae bacterium]|nr:hypothetical protein [Planctomycetaceae bacterium]
MLICAIFSCSPENNEFAKESGLKHPNKKLQDVVCAKVNCVIALQITNSDNGWEFRSVLKSKSMAILSDLYRIPQTLEELQDCPEPSEPIDLSVLATSRFSTGLL